MKNIILFFKLCFPFERCSEVTGYVVEEKYYSDNKSKPTVERKEFIYSTNPEELKKLKDQVEISGNRKALEDVDVKETRKTALIVSFFNLDLLVYHI